VQKFEAHEDYILKCALSPDVKYVWKRKKIKFARYLATCSADKQIKLWNYTSDKRFTLNKVLYGKKERKKENKLP